jgi:Ala-tRNA(Pro) deacylase
LSLAIAIRLPLARALRAEKGAVMSLNKLKEFLEANNVKYQLVQHSTAYTAQEIASRAHISGQELAKTVMLKVDHKLAMAVLPASEHVDLAAIKEQIGAESVRLAAELEFAGCFPDCETGAMPPFGNLYGLPVLVEETLARDKQIAFNAGSHTELMQLAYEDFARLVNPRMVQFRRQKVRRAAAGEDRLW